jgi:hypothetical protein
VIDNNTSTTQTVQAGQIASYNLDVRPLDTNTTFPQNVALSCSSLPPLSTCSFTPAQVSGGSGDTNVVLRVATTAPIASAHVEKLAWQNLWFVLPALVFAAVPVRGESRRRAAVVLIVLVIGLSPGCGGGNGSGGGAGQPGTPTGDYTITVNATMGSTTHITEAKLAVN